jgi:prepilin-type N-terminal cleavage/methylation domain-containing protein
MQKQTQKGFTLIELLVVMAIIGILSSVVLASVSASRRRARDARRHEDMKALQTALNLYYDGAGGQRYVIQTSTTPSNALASTALAPLVSAQITTEIGADPLPTGAYYYVSNASGTSYCLAAEMEGADTNDGCLSSLNSTMDTVTGAATNGDYRTGP